MNTDLTLENRFLNLGKIEKMKGGYGFLMLAVLKDNGLFFK